MQGTSPDSILCITFTTAGAAEMHERVLRKLRSWLTLPEPELITALEALLERTPSAADISKARCLMCELLEASPGLKVQTIHSFCQSLLRRFPLESGLSPHFTVMDERSAGELLGEAQQTVISQSEQHSQALQDALAFLAKDAGEHNFSTIIKSAVSSRGRFQQLLSQHAQPEAIHQLLYDKAGVEPDDTAQTLQAKHLSPSTDWRVELKAAADHMAGLSQKGPKEAAEAIYRWLETGDCTAYLDFWLTGKGELKAFKQVQGMADDSFSIVERERVRIKAYVDTLGACHIARATCHVVTLAEAILSIYQQQKAAKGLLDYDDLIFYSLNLLERADIMPWILFKLDQSIAHILLDEAQDTSPTQWKLIRLLAEHLSNNEEEHTPSIFIVGDLKQSIYSFQGAEPKLFLDSRSHLPPPYDSKITPQYIEQSFRSTREVLALVDAVSNQPAIRHATTYEDKQVMHPYARKDAAGRVEIWPVVQAEQAETEAWHIPQQAHTQQADAQTELANQIAARIADWLRNKQPLAARGRAVQPADIMILLRERKELAQKLIAALRRHDVPVAGLDRMVVNEHIAVEDMVALAQFCLLPDDDLNLACVLKSPFVGIDEDALLQLGYGREGSLWHSLQTHAEDDITLARHVEKLEHIKAAAFTQAPYEWCMYVLEEQGGLEDCAARLGAEVREVLNEFLSQVLLYEKNNAATLQGFIHWFQQGRTEIKRDMEQGIDAVRVMTVHASKGLQAPIVILPDTTSLPHASKIPSLQWPPDNDGLPWHTPSGRSNHPLIRPERDRLQQNAKEEYYRLLYVALTRAADELYICGATKDDKPPHADCWYSVCKHALSALDEAEEAEDGTVSLASPASQAAPTAGATDAESARHVTLPEWWHKNASNEPAIRWASPSSLVAPVTTSQAKTSSNNAAERGTLVHLLLEWLPLAPSHQWHNAGSDLVARHAPHMPEGERQALLEQALRVMQDDTFAEVFAEGSHAEVSLCGTITMPDGSILNVSGQVDRLCITEHTVYIIDYKSNLHPPAHISDVPETYRLQLYAYRELIKQLYSDKVIKSALLWTTTPSLLDMTNALDTTESTPPLQIA